VKLMRDFLRLVVVLAWALGATACEPLERSGARASGVLPVDAGERMDAGRWSRDAGRPSRGHDAAPDPSSQAGSAAERVDAAVTHGTVADAGMPSRPMQADAGDGSSRNPERQTGEEDGGALERDAGAASSPDAGAPSLLAMITEVAAEGSLCLPSSFEPSVSSDGAALTLTFSAAELQANVGEKLEGACDIELRLVVPAGYTFGQVGVRPSGYLYAMTGKAGLQVDYAFPSTGASQRFVHADLVGDTSYVFDDVAELWSPSCVRPDEPTVVELMLSLRATAENEAYFSMLAVDLDLAAVSGTAWRACDEMD
jgi:hypothetical protein